MITTAQAIEASAPAPRARRNASTTAAVRRLPSCDPQPPFDDEIAPATLGDPATNRTSANDSDHGQRALRLVFALPSGLPARPELPDTLRKEPGHTAPDLHLVPTLNEPSDNAVMTVTEPRAPRRPGRRDSVEEEFGPQRTTSRMLPAPTPWAGRLVQAVIEVVSGVRPVSQLVRWTTAPIYEALCASVARPVASAATGSRGVANTRLAEVVRSVRVSEPRDGVAEVCAIVQQGPRCRAIALRLEGIDGRWQCTALQIG
jgi:hypothetical protein